MREDVALSRPEQHISANPFHRELTLLGDRGVTLHGGSSRELHRPRILPFYHSPAGKAMLLKEPAFERPLSGDIPRDGWRSSPSRSRRWSTNYAADAVTFLLCARTLSKFLLTRSACVRVLSLLVLAITFGSAQLASTQSTAPSPAKPYDPRLTFAPLSLPDPVNVYRSSNGTPGPGYWQNQASYEMHATLDTKAHSLVNDETITYTNNSPDALETLWLQVEQNIYRKDSRARIANGGMQRRRKQVTRRRYLRLRYGWLRLRWRRD